MRFPGGRQWRIELRNPGWFRGWLAMRSARSNRAAGGAHVKPRMTPWMAFVHVGSPPHAISANADSATSTGIVLHASLVDMLFRIACGSPHYVFKGIGACKAPRLVIPTFKPCGLDLKKPIWHLRF